MGRKEITVNTDLLMEQISKLKKMKGRTEKKYSSLNAKLSKIGCKGDMAEELAEISSYTDDRADALEKLIQNTLLYLEKVKKEFEDGDNKIANSISVD